jgi:hypothetical protein
VEDLEFLSSSCCLLKFEERTWLDEKKRVDPTARRRWEGEWREGRLKSLPT